MNLFYWILSLETQLLPTLDCPSLRFLCWLHRWHAIPWRCDTFASTTFDSNSRPSWLVPNNTSIPIRGLFALHFHEFFTQLFQNPFHLFVFCLCRSKRLFKLLKALLLFQQLAFSHLQVNLKFWPLTDHALVADSHLLMALFKHLHLFFKTSVICRQTHL